MNSTLVVTNEYKKFLESLKQHVVTARLQAIRSVNRTLTALYHQIGSDILKQQAKYGWGAKIIDRLSHDLSTTFPEMKGFSPRNLKICAAGCCTITMVSLGNAHGQG